MRKHIGIIALILAVALIGVLVITPLLAQEEEEEAPARGCGIATGCHSPESKYNLQHEIDGIEGHPSIEVSSVKDCAKCHEFRTVEESGGSVNLANSLHFVHLTSEHFEGNCFSCHMIDEDGEMALFNFVTGNF